MCAGVERLGGGSGWTGKHLRGDRLVGDGKERTTAGVGEEEREREGKVGVPRRRQVVRWRGRRERERGGFYRALHAVRGKNRETTTMARLRWLCRHAMAV